MNNEKVIEAKNLRVGNLLKCAGISPDHIISVDQITQDGIVPTVDINGMMGETWGFESFEPIPLDEGWLIRAGFEKYTHPITNDINYEDYRLGNFVVILNGMLVEFAPAPFSVDDRSHIHNGLRYVHQLQNLYYVLTGTELEFKPK